MLVPPLPVNDKLVALPVKLSLISFKSIVLLNLKLILVVNSSVLTFDAVKCNELSE